MDVNTPAKAQSRRERGESFLLGRGSSGEVRMRMSTKWEEWDVRTSVEVGSMGSAGGCGRAVSVVRVTNEGGMTYIADVLADTDIGGCHGCK